MITPFATCLYSAVGEKQDEVPGVYSFLNEVTGLINAAFILWNPTAIKVMDSVNTAATKIIHHSRSTWQAKPSSQA